jgi:hypothetical protein
VPEFNNLSVDDAYQAYLEENNLENDDFPLEKKYERGEYIFLIDRSGSMDGPRIVKVTVKMYVRLVKHSAFSSSLCPLIHILISTRLVPYIQSYSREVSNTLKRTSNPQSHL